MYVLLTMHRQRIAQSDANLVSHLGTGELTADGKSMGRADRMYMGACAHLPCNVHRFQT